MTYTDVSLADIEDAILSNKVMDSPVTTVASTSGTQTYRRPGSFIDPDTFKAFGKVIADQSNIYMGQGSGSNYLQNFLSRIDRFGTALAPTNVMNPGFTFITRPRLNLSFGNIRQHPVLNTLWTEKNNTIPFMIRALLDTRLCNGQPLFRGKGASYSSLDAETKSFSEAASRSGLVDVLNPFFIPLCNGLTGISGFPDFNLETETSEGDFHSGDHTFVKGGDMNNRTQELSLEFKDTQGSVILSSVFYWCLVMALQAKGVIMAYPDDIYEQRLNYTVSIYRFVMDPSRNNILWWAKATGCFPKSAAVGALFNKNQGDSQVSAATNFSVPFTANDIKYNDPGIILDFNLLMKRYCPKITDPDIFVNVGQNAQHNYIGLPYIDTKDSSGLKLLWKTANYYSDVLFPGGTTVSAAVSNLSETIASDKEVMVDTFNGG